MNDKQNNDNNGGNNNNFFNNNPLLVFVIFSIVTIFAFKALFPENQMGSGSNNGVTPFNSQSKNQTVPYSELKKLITSGQIEYVGIGNTQIRAVSKSSSGQVTTYTARRVIPDETLVASLEKKWN